MRGLWRTLAYMAEDVPGFNSELVKVTGTVSTNLIDNLKISSDLADPRSLSLSKQPTAGILQNVDSCLQSKVNPATYPNLKLSWYELAEVNRLTEVGKAQSQFTQALKDYWQGLGAGTAAHRNDLGFMEAVGALSISKWTRDQMRAAGPSFLHTRFDLTDPQAQLFSDRLTAGSQAEIAAQKYFALGWPHVCASVATADANWFHINE